MRNNAKRWLSLLMAGVMVCSLVVVPVSAAEGENTLSQPKKYINSYKVGDGTENNEDDVKYGNNGYFVKIDSDDSANKDWDSLTEMLQEKKPSYKAIDEKGEPVTLNVTWKKADNNPPHLPKGYAKDDTGTPENVWYYFTAEWSETDELRDYIIDLPKPQAYIRVYPVKAVQTLDVESKTVSPDEVNNWTDWENQLPKMVKITYDRDPKEDEPELTAYMDSADINQTDSPWAAYSQFPSEDLVTYADTESSETGPTSSFPITYWEMDGKRLTLEDLKAAANITAGEKVLELTPIYDNTEYVKNNKNQYFIGDEPKFRLIINSKTEAEVDVTLAPDTTITYGDKLENTIIVTVKVNGKVENDVKYDLTYEGIKVEGNNDIIGTPRDAGDYRVTATLNDNTYKGSGTSEKFTIHPKTIEFTGTAIPKSKPEDSQTYNVTDIIAKEKTYNGELDAELDTADIFNNPIFEGDDAAFEITGSFDNKNVRFDTKTPPEVSETQATIKAITLTGKDAGNYKTKITLRDEKGDNPIEEKGELENGHLKAMGMILPRPLTIDTSNIIVIKGDNGAGPRLANQLQLNGVCKGEVQIKDQVRVDNCDKGSGTVTLSNIVLELTKAGEADKVNLTSYTFTEDDDKSYKITKKPTDVDESYTIEISNAHIFDTESDIPSVKPAPEQDTHYMVGIPDPSPCDGKPREATVEPKSDKTLGTPTFTYAKRKPDNTYDDFITDSPQAPGVYKVRVSFAESKDFAAVDNVDVEEPLIIYRKSDVLTYDCDITIYPGEKIEDIKLTDLKLQDGKTLPVDVKIKESAYRPSDPKEDLLEIGSVTAGKTDFTLKALPVSMDSKIKSQDITLVLESPEYKEITLNVHVKLGSVKINPPTIKIKPGNASDGTSFVLGTALRDILTVEPGTGSVELGGVDVPGTFDLLEPDSNLGGGEYDKVSVLFTSSDGKYTIPAEVKTETRFIVRGQEGVVTVTPPDNITYGQSLGNPTVSVPNGTVTDDNILYTYEGVLADGTTYGPSIEKPEDAGTYTVTATLNDPDYMNASGTSGPFTIRKAAPTEEEAYITVPNGETKKIDINVMIDEQAPVPGVEAFLPNDMARGAKIKEPPVIATDGKPVESYTANVGDSAFTVKSASSAPNGSVQTFTLVLDSNNYEKITVTVTVYNDNVEVTGIKLKSPGPFPSGTAWKDIIDLSDCAAKVNRTPTSGTFELMEPDATVEGPNAYDEYPVKVLFTTSTGLRYPVTVPSPPFRVLVPEESAETYFAIYANSSHNRNAEALRNFVQSQKGTHQVGTQTFRVDWKTDNNLSFDPKGLRPNSTGANPTFAWYSYTAALDGSNQIKAYLTVIPVEATPSLAANRKTVKAANIREMTEENWVAALGLPATSAVTWKPAVEYGQVTEAYDGTDSPGTLRVTGWQMDDSTLTLDALKAKASTAASQDVKLTLTPVFGDAPAWATIVGLPVFELTITPKNPVGVSWDGPDDITYGDELNLGTPTQQDNGSGTDPSGTWDFVYYNEDGTKLPGQPTNAGTYQVQAILNSATHSGASALMEFRINSKGLTAEGITAERAASDELVYNKQPQTPEYIVKDGERTLVEGTDYTVAYTNNINAGIAVVTFTGIGNYTGKIEENFTIEKFPLTADKKPVISGNAAAGQVLSASLPGVDSAELEWCWTVDGVEVKDCIAASYEVKPEDSNKAITVTAKARKNGNYSGASGESESVTVDKFRVTGSVTITASETSDDGKIVTGTELTASASVNPSAAESRGTWSWIVDGVEKGNGNTYTVEDVDKEIVAVFTPNEDYTGTVESAVIEVGKILLTGKVEITGGTDVGDELTADVSGPTLEEGKTFIYTWLRNGEPIPGADDDTYTITPEDRGKTISVKVTAEGYTGELISADKEIPAVEPGAPTVSVTAGDGKLIINWNAPADNGGAPVTGYKLKVTEEGASDTLLEIILAANVMSYTVEGLTNGKAYSISVSAVNRVDEGEPCTVDGTPKPPESGGNGNNGDNDNNGGNDNNGDSGDGSFHDRRPGSSGDSSDDDSDNPTVSSTTTTSPDGSTITVAVKKDGSVVTTVQSGDGRRASIVTDPSGLTAATVYLPSLVAGRAANGSSIVTLPVQGIYASQNIDRASTVTVNTSGVNGVKVDIPLVNKGIGVVAVLVNPDGTEKIIKNTIPTQDGIAVRLNNGDTIKILDNSMSFADIGGHWANDAVTFVSARGLFYGTKANIFSPDAEMTRGMLVTVLARYADVDTEGGATWYEKGVAWAVSNGLSDGTNLEGSITREQLSAIMYRYARLQGRLSGTGADLQAYTDAGSISDWAVDAMSWAVGAGLIKGTTPTTLDPQGSASRAQVAAVFMRYAELFGL